MSHLSIYFSKVSVNYFGITPNVWAYEVQGF